MESFDHIIRSGTPVLVDFYAEWCGPCKVLAPILKDIAHLLDGKAKIVKVDIDKSPIAAYRYNIRSVPTLLLFKNGHVIWRFSGAMAANDLAEKLLDYTK